MQSTESQPEYMPIGAICQRLTGTRPAPATVWRWIRRGVRGHRLHALRIRGRWYCTRADMHDFLLRSTEATLGDLPATSTDDDALRAAGLL